MATEPETLAGEPILPSKKGGGRGIETLFRTNYRSQLELTQLADMKASIMVSINGILISITFGFVSTQIQQNPWLLIPTTPMLVGMVTSLTLAVLAARPSWARGGVSLDDVRAGRNDRSLLYFGAFATLSRAEFEQGVRHLMEDRDALYGNLIRDLYGLGKTLEAKYVRLRWAYTVFFVTLVVSVAVFVASFHLLAQSRA